MRGSTELGVNGQAGAETNKGIRRSVLADTVKD